MQKKCFGFIASVCLALVFVFVGANSASAQTDDWTGFYAGGYVGVSHARPNVSTSTAANADGYFVEESVTQINADGTASPKSNGFTGGGQFGYNKQFGRIVVGAEADFGSRRVSAFDFVTNAYTCCEGDYSISQQVKSNWLFTARPRIGVTAGKALIYATGGLAVTDVKYSATFSDTFADALETGAFSKTKAGYAAGAGVEVKVAKRWSVKGEYLFSDFGRDTITSDNLTSISEGPVSWPENVFTHSARLKSHDFRFGVNYRF